MLFSSLLLAAQFPEDWVGIYEGEVSGAATPTIMRLRIEKLCDDRYRWAIQYSGESERAYELITIDKKAGKYIVDEKNGIVIDHFLREGTLYSAFTVNSKWIVFKYTLNDKGILIESQFFSTTPSRTSGTDQFRVESFLLANIQRGLLKRAGDP